MTVVCHVDDIQVSHKSKNIVTVMTKWLKKTHERLFEDRSGNMKISRGNIHEYLVMKLYFRTSRSQDYCDTIYWRDGENFSKHDDTVKTSATPASYHLFKAIKYEIVLEETQAIIYHNLVAKALFATNISRPEIHTAVAFIIM